MSKGIEWEGVNKLLKGIEKFEEEYLSAVRRIVAETAIEIQTRAQALAPVDEGNLRKSIDITFENGGLSAKIIVGAEYAIFLEFGSGIYAEGGDGRKDPWVYWSDKLGRFVYTRGIRAQPFFRPAYESGLKHFVREMNKLG